MDNNTSSFQQKMIPIEISTIKWYDNKLYLLLSVAVFPLFFYGLYKSNVVSKNMKILFGIIVAFMYIGSYSGDKNSGGGTGSLHQSSWDNSVPCVESYIKSQLNDPGSYESVEWDKASKNGDGTYTVMHTYSAKNSYGGRVRHTGNFTIDKDGETVIRVMDF